MSSASSECASPTRCRPQHLDRERLRGVLSSAQFADVRYHEAVVVAARAKPKSFQLLALATDCVHLFPLASAHHSGAEPPPTRIPLKHVVAVDIASPALSGQRGLMLEPTSQLFHILVREKSKLKGKDKVEVKPKSPKAVDAKTPRAEKAEIYWKESEYFVSTFEPDSRVFFYVSQAFQAHFQKWLLQPHAGFHKHRDKSSSDSEDQPSAGEVAELLDSLIDELVSEPEHEQKSALLNELAVAGTCNLHLQRAFFANRTQLRLSSSNDDDARAPTSTGLPALLIRELAALLVERPQQEDKHGGLSLGSLEYVASALNVLFRMCFGGQLLSERLHFFLESSLEELVLVATATVSRRSEPKDSISATRSLTAMGSQTASLALEEILDCQVALLLELEALQQEANAVDSSYWSRSTTQQHVSQLVLRSPSFAKWLGKLFKRIARSVSRTEAELETSGDRNGGSCWSLTLWRNVKLLDMLWNAPSASTRVLALLLESRLDYLNLYLRNPRYLEALRSSSTRHVQETAERLQSLLDALPDATTH